MVVFNNGYYHAMDRDYNPTPSERTAGKGVVGIRELGQSIIDGSRGGRFQQSVQAAIRGGAARLELNPQPEHGFGVETYSKEERAELKALAKINDVVIHGVHAPPQVVGNLTGMGQNGFSEERRGEHLEEIKKHIDFAADAMDGGHVVVHTGEFPRSISHAKWNNGSGMFEGYPGEAEEAIYYLVDPHSGQIIKGVREDEKIYVPEFGEDGNPRFDQEKGEFVVKPLSFKEFREQVRAENPELAKDNLQVAKQFIVQQQETERLRLEGQAHEYESRWRMIKSQADEAEQAYKQAQARGVPPDQLKDLKVKQEYYSREAQAYQEIALGARRSMEQQKEMTNRIVTIDEYGKKKAFDSLAELGVYAMDVEEHKHTKNPIYMAPENVFPQMGYGAHPEEIIEFVQGARKEMVEKLTKKEMYNEKTQQMESNPYFRSGVSEDQAKRLAEKHIKATFDTQHLGMWYKHFKSKPGESEEAKVKRFNNWYMDNVKKMEKANVIGNLHIVDGFGRGHQHLVPGEGMFPVVEAVEYLKKKGYTGNMISEAFEAQGGRQLTGAWEAFGMPIYSFRGGPQMGFSDIQQSYFGRVNIPPFVFGSYSTHKEDWAPWSGVPFE